MATKLEKLMFRIGVKDDASGPVGKLQKALRSTSRMSKQAWGQLAGGAMTVAGAGLALEGMVSPALDLNRALADVSSLDVDAKGLKLLDATAKQYAMSYGGTAAEFVASSYAIQSGIAGLDASQLADFTRASNVLAKATKADAATMTNYAGTMYGIFKQQADAQGKSSWIEDVAGKSAYAIQIFKTSGTEMSAAFTALGANATSSGIKLEEQMAILGKLQATMSGSEAGTKYKAFLAGVGQAQKELGLKFTDGQGRMLPVLQILDKLKKKYGALDVLADSDLIKKAFGFGRGRIHAQAAHTGHGRAGRQHQGAGRHQGHGEGGGYGPEDGRSLPQAERRAQHGVGGMVAEAPPARERCGRGFQPLHGQGAVVHRHLPEHHAPAWVSSRLSVSLVRRGVRGLFNVVAGLAKLGVLGLFNPFSKLIGFLFGTKAAGTGAAGGVGGLVNIFGALKKAWLLFNSAILGTPVGWILIGLIAVIAALAINWEDFKKNFGDTAFGSAVIQMVQDVCAWWDRLTNAFSERKLVRRSSLRLINAVTAPLRKFLELVGWALEKVGLIDSDSSFYAMTKPLDEKTFETVGKLAGSLERRLPDYLSGCREPIPRFPKDTPRRRSSRPREGLVLSSGGTRRLHDAGTLGFRRLSPDTGIPQLVPLSRGCSTGAY